MLELDFIVPSEVLKHTDGLELGQKLWPDLLIWNCTA